MTHLKNLLFYIPDLSSKKVLDVGAGKGKFVIECVLAGLDVRGIEYNEANVLIARENAKALGVSIDIQTGKAEHLNFGDSTFDFLNYSEVIEHVASPKTLLTEAYRVLKRGGQAYVSAPSRFGWYDPHFHLMFVNWLPRSWSDSFIKLFGSEKKYDLHSGHQRLSEMHYYTFRGFLSLANQVNFKVEDMRLLKIRKLFRNTLVRQVASVVYILIRPWYFRTFHFLITKN